MYRLPLLFTCLFVLPALLAAQGMANNWVQGEYRIDFGQEDPQVSPARVEMESFTSAAAVSDADGKLLFYTDGSTVWNREDAIMSGGQLDASDTMYFAASVIVPQPGHPDTYYLFSVQAAGNRQDQRSGLFYSVIDRSLDNGLGAVVSGPARLTGPVTELLSAYHSTVSGKTWIMARGAYGNRYLAFPLTVDGLAGEPVETLIGSTVHASDGQLKFSPDGKHVATGYGTFGSGDGQPGEGVQLFDFDEGTGRLSNDLLLLLPENRDVASVEFSPDGTLLYAFQSGSTYEQALYQYDITVARSQVDATRYRVAAPDVTGLSDMQLAANGKIYLSKGGGYANGLEYLAVIHDPNRRGSLCDFVELGLYLSGASAGYSTPLFRQDLLFRTDFSYGPQCAGGAGRFTVTNAHALLAARWDFGDGATDTGTETFHQFGTAGEYQVVLYAQYADHVDTLRRRVTVNPATPLDLGPDREFCVGAELSVGEEFVSYRWHRGDTTRYLEVTDAGPYSLAATNQYGCEMTDTVIVTLGTSPLISLPDTAFLSEAGTITLDPGAFASYRWNTGDTTRTLSTTRRGWYSVSVSNAAGCSTERSVFVAFPGEQPYEEETKWKRLNPLPTGKTHFDIAFADRNAGFIAGAEGLLRTTDAGVRWEIVAGIQPVRRIAFEDGIGYSVGDYGLVYKSTHNGMGWNQLYTPISGNINAISLLHPDTLFLTTETELHFSGDGGATWITRAIPDLEVSGSYFLNERTGFAVGKEAIILKTTDAGETWSVVLGPSPYYGAEISHIQFVTDRLGFATGAGGELYRTADGGDSWTDVSPTGSTRVYDLWFLDARRGHLVGEYGLAYYTLDGGLTWEWEGADGLRGENDLYGVTFTDENVGYTVGMKGRILKTTDGGTSWTRYSPTYEDIKQLHFPTIDTGYVIALNRIYKTTDRGDSWSPLPTPIPEEKVIELNFVTGRLGYVIVGGSTNSSAYSNEVYRTDDGGQSWTKPHQGTIGYDDLTSITFLDEQRGFVSQRFGSTPLYKTTNGGATWKSTTAPAVGDLQFIDDKLGFGINWRGYTLSRTVDGGDTWEQVLEGREDIRAFHFVDESVGYAVGDNAYLARTADGGNTWADLELPYEYYIDVKFVNRDTGYVLDEEGLLYLTTDAGSSWTLDNQTYGITSIELIGTDAYLAGRWGSILTARGERPEAERPAVVSVEYVDGTRAVLTTDLPEYPDTLRLQFTYGTSATRLDRATEVTTLDHSASGTKFELTLDELEPGTSYYGQFAFDDGLRQSTSEVVTFTTARTTAVTEDGWPDLILAPNPVADRFTVRLSGRATTGPVRYRLIDSRGQIVTEAAFVHETEVEVGGYAPGLYSLQLYREGTMATRRLIIVR